MKIAFIGQLGFPALHEQEKATPERRVKALAEELADQGHEVNVYGTAPYLRRGQFKGIKLVQMPSFDPTKPGGWLYIIWSLLQLLFAQQDTIHVQGIKAAFTSRFIWALLPHRIWVMTIDSLPHQSTFLSRWYVRFGLVLADTVVAPTRTIQYRLYNEFSIRAQYVPDGFKLHPNPNALPPKTGLKKNGYVVLLGEDTKALRAFAKAAKQAKIKQRLVIASKETPAIKRLANQYPKVKLLSNVGSRQRQALVSNSVGVVLADASTPASMVLKTMSHATPVVSVLAPHYQELLGPTARFVTLKDYDGIAAALIEQLHDRKATLKARAARTRATRHFTWERITKEYLQAYHGSEVQTLPLDSVRPVTFTLPAPARSL